MKPTDFTGSNRVFAKDQPQYLPLPALDLPGGEVITCWKLSFRERLKLLFTGRLWFSQLTFGMPLQPQRPDVNRPFRITKGGE